MPATVLEPDAEVTRLVASNDGSRIAAVDARGTVSAWTLADGYRMMLGHVDGRVTEIAISGTTVVTGTAEGKLTFWTQPAPAVHQLEGIVKSIAVSPDRIAVATSAGPIVMFSLAGSPLPAIEGNVGGTEVVAFDPSGTLLAAGGQDRAIRVWQRQGEAFVSQAVLEGGINGDTHFLAFSAAGDRLISGSNDGAVMMWSVHAGAVQPASQVTVTRHTGAVSALAFDPAGHWIASAGRDDVLVRTELTGETIGAAQTAHLGAAAIALAFDDGGTLRVVTRAGALERWSGDHPPTIEIEHGVTTGLQIPSTRRWALAHDDGAIVLAPLEAHDLADLVALLARATTYVQQ